MRLSEIPMIVKKRCVEMYLDGASTKQIYTEYYSHMFDTSYDSFGRALRRWRAKAVADNEILEKGSLSYRFTPHATTVQIGKDGEITQSWIKSRTEDRLYMELIDAVKACKPVEITASAPKNAEKRMLEIPLFDLHFGIATAEHYADTLEDILRIISKCTYDKIYILIGSDLFHNDDFRGRTSSGKDIEKVDIAQAWEDAKSFYYSIIEKTFWHANSVHIMYTKGNHDESMSWAFTQMIKAQYGHRIEVDDSLKQRKLITYGTNFIGITHGDQARRKPIDLRSQFTIEFPVEFAESKVRELHVGHLHREAAEDVYGIMCRTLSTGT